MRLARHNRRLWRDERGVAAVEASLVIGIFVVGLLNAVEIGRYAYTRMEVSQATQAAAEAALVACDTDHVPATKNCPDLTTAVTAAIQGTSLGSKVVLDGDITEGYYCVNGENVLVFASDLTSKPSDCGDFGNSGLAPVLYLQVHATYSYTPIFHGLTVAQSFPSEIKSTTWMRML